MGFRLKDKQLQEKLDKLSNGDFSKVLWHLNMRIRSYTVVPVKFGKRIEDDSNFIAFFFGRELEWVENKNGIQTKR